MCFSIGTLIPSAAADPASNNARESWSWRDTGSLNAARARGTATLLQNGMVIVAGGYDENFLPTHTTELYDPVTGTWIVTGSLNTARTLPTATLLRNGMVLIVGGYIGGNSTPTAELYDPSLR